METFYFEAKKSHELQILKISNLIDSLIPEPKSVTLKDVEPDRIGYKIEFVSEKEKNDFINKMKENGLNFGLE